MKNYPDDYRGVALTSVVSKIYACIPNRREPTWTEQEEKMTEETGKIQKKGYSTADHNNNNNRIQRRYSRFFTISSQRRELSPTRTLKWPGHVHHIERLSRASVMLRATWYEGTAQLLSLTVLKSHLFELYFIGWTIKPMKEGRKPEYPEKTPGDELQKMPHTPARRFKPQSKTRTRAVALVAG